MHKNADEALSNFIWEKPLQNLPQYAIFISTYRRHCAVTYHRRHAAKGMPFVIKIDGHKLLGPKYSYQKKENQNEKTTKVIPLALIVAALLTSSCGCNSEHINTNPSVQTKEEIGSGEGAETPSMQSEKTWVFTIFIYCQISGCRGK